MKSSRFVTLAAGVVLAAAGCTGGDTAPRVRLGDGAVSQVEGAAPAAQLAAAELPAITVYKSPTCLCCGAWEDHLRAHGFDVRSVPTEDMTAIKVQHRVPAHLSSCHTALVDGYVIEGHVPADLIAKLISERPQVLGLTAPGMPMGSPGMEGPIKEDYDVLTFDAAGQTTVYARR